MSGWRGSGQRPALVRMQPRRRRSADDRIAVAAGLLLAIGVAGVVGLEWWFGR